MLTRLSLARPPDGVEDRRLSLAGAVRTLHQMWHVVIPLKGWQAAKSRIALSDDMRVRLVQAMVADTLAVVANCEAVSRITVLAADRTLVGSPVLSPADSVVMQPDATPTLNAALCWFADSRRDLWTPIVVVVADLPAARPASLIEVLAAAHAAAGTGHPSAMVADRSGSGTTVLTAATAEALVPHFGPGSARAHQRQGAVALPGAPDLACDVDTLDDLRWAQTIGLGPHTGDLVARLSS